MVSRSFLQRVAQCETYHTKNYKYVAMVARLANNEPVITVRRWKKIPLDRPHYYVLDTNCEFIAIFTLSGGWEYYKDVSNGKEIFDNVTTV